MLLSSSPMISTEPGGGVPQHVSAGGHSSAYSNQSHSAVRDELKSSWDSLHSPSPADGQLRSRVRQGCRELPSLRLMQ